MAGRPDSLQPPSTPLVVVRAQGCPETQHLMGGSAVRQLQGRWPRLLPGTPWGFGAARDRDQQSFGFGPGGPSLFGSRLAAACLHQRNLGSVQGRNSTGVGVPD
jgi:hypothetical protein